MNSGEYIVKKELISNGLYPVYSSQTNNNGEIGRLNSYTHDGEYITIAMYGANAGEVFYRNEKFTPTQLCGVIEQNSNLIDVRFFYHYLKKNVPLYVLEGSGIPTVTTGKLKNVKIPLLSLEKQKKISLALDYFEKYCSEISGILPVQISLLEKQYKYFLNKLLKTE
ncbi:restriction endonuclease subunit S [Mycoplasmopsis columboralis]|uniref:restriction endonuclease subunit S n=1 Tax=Mycoplasmopsis columboralis TaxID=171282 RepID=UPI0013EDD0AB|nr:restriction endonuclease subunit S [Mycoplasmopsis columboralis]